MFETIWCAVNRTTRDGKVLGEDEKISVLEAIKTVTINAAYQYGEEEIKGSLKAGKNADFIIVDKNPLKVAKDELRNIKILETIKDGKVIWKIWLCYIKILYNLYFLWYKKCIGFYKMEK